MSLNNFCLFLSFLCFCVGGHLPCHLLVFRCCLTQVWQPLERMEPTGIGVDRATGTLYVAGKLRCVSALSALPPFDRLHSLTGGTHDTMIDWPKGLCVDAPRGLLFVGFEAHVGVFRTLA